MDVIAIVNEIETGNNPFQDGLDYYMDCKVKVNNIRTRCEQISIVECDMSECGRGIETLLEIRRGDFITWAFVDEIETLKVDEFLGDE